MNHKILPIALIFIISGCTTAVPQSSIDNPAKIQQNSTPSPQVVTQQPQASPVSSTPSGIAMPLTNALVRITTKTFGIYVAPQNSPIQPEKFIGYHAGTDFEIFPDEADKDVSVFAICTGKIVLKRLAQGYGGVLVQACTLDDQAVTVAYGHLKLTSIAPNIGDTLAEGENFAVLGKAYSDDTNGERKHLHLGIKKGTLIDLHGYVQNKTELSGWLDFEELL